MDLIGSGISFPMYTDSRGGLALASGAEDVGQAIRVILGTTPGERPMRPEFGCRLTDFLFEPLDSVALGRLREEVMAALERWEPRATVLSVECRMSTGGESLVLLDIAYALVTTNAVHNLVYPFYFVPAEPE